MLSTFILSASTIDDPDIRALYVGSINHASFIKDMCVLRRKDVVAPLVDEHMD